MAEKLIPTTAPDSAAPGLAEADGLEFLPDLIASLTAEGLTDRELVTQLGFLETITCAAAAAKAELTAGLDGQRSGSRGVGHEVALARRESPWMGRQRVQLARTLTTEMPHALAALRRGDLNEDKAMTLMRESEILPPEARGRLDAELASRYAWLSTKELTIATRRAVARLDPQGADDRARRAREKRNVTCRNIGEGMCRITGQVPAESAITTMESLRDHATMRRKMGDARTRDQIMADAFTDRLNESLLPGGSPAPEGGPRPQHGVEIQLVMNAEMLLGVDTITPAHLPGYGPLPMGIVSEMLASDDLTVLVRRLFTNPDDNSLVAMDSKGILFRHGLRRMIFARDGDTCRTPGCNAPPRHVDHVTSRARGGSTDLDDGQGLCQDCNYTKEEPGWRHQTQTTWPEQHRVKITTPTGHTYDSQAPPLPVTPHGTTITTTGLTCEVYLSDLELCWEAPPAA